MGNSNPGPMGCGNSDEKPTANPVQPPPGKITKGSTAPESQNWGLIIKGRPVDADLTRTNLSIQEALHYALTGDPRAGAPVVDDKDTPVANPSTMVEYDDGKAVKV